MAWKHLVHCAMFVTALVHVASPAHSQCGSPQSAPDCCKPALAIGCQDETCCEAVCEIAPLCCSLASGWQAGCAYLATQVCDICPHPCGEGKGDCCSANGSAGCDDPSCCDIVCAMSPGCCMNNWTQTCANLAKQHCAQCITCGSPGTGNCCEANDSPFCNDAFCCQSVCDQLPHCCDSSGGWDESCATLAANICGSASNCNPNSCKFHCGGRAPGGCWCDEFCFAFKDCCDWVCTHCAHSPCTDSSNNSCVGFCGALQAPSGCGCEEGCMRFGFPCCPDYLSCQVCPTPFWCPSPPHPFDLTGNGTIGVGDLLVLLSKWGACEPPGPCVGDLDGDRNVGVPDLLFLLGNWGPVVPPHLSCAGNCGGQASGGCWCDEACCQFQDCCDDKFEACRGCQP